MTTEEKAKAYDEAFEKARKRVSTEPQDDTDAILKYIFPELCESEDERIRKVLLNLVSNDKVAGYIKFYEERGITCDDAIAYLEKQKYNRMQPVYDNQESFESALDKAWKSYNESGSRTVDSCEDDYVECAHAKGFREGYLFGLEKQEDASKAIEAVERIDKYIDEHLANAHDMKDSNPDKKYYRGWDDALGKMSGILQDIYSGEKQKEQPKEELIYRLNGLMQEYIKEGKDEAEKEHRFKCYQLFWDALKDTSYFEQKEQKPVVTHGETYHVDTLCTQQVIAGKMPQKPAEWSEEDKSFYDSIIREVIKEGMHPTPEQAKWFKLLPERFNLQPKNEWNEEDERMRNQLIYDIEYHKKEGLISAKQNKATKTLYNEIEKCYDEKIAWLKSLPLNLKKKNEDVAKLCSNEWSEEDENHLHSIYHYLRILKDNSDNDSVKKNIEEHINWLSKRYQILLESQPKQEWSKEDEEALREVKLNFELNHDNMTPTLVDFYERFFNKLKSFRSQPHCKPSKEQMEALFTVLEHEAEREGHSKALEIVNGFYDNLKN